MILYQRLNTNSHYITITSSISIPITSSGDAQEEKYVNQASVLYRKQVLPASKKVVYEGPSKDQLTKSIDLHCQEPVRYVTFDPENWVQEEGFNVTLKMKHKKTTAQKGTTLCRSFI